MKSTFLKPGKQGLMMINFKKYNNTGFNLSRVKATGNIFSFSIWMILYLFSFSNFQNLLANDISLPSYPVDPSFPQVEQSKNTRGSDVKKQVPTSSMKVEIIAILGTSDEVRGFIMIPEKISFKHYKNGLVYNKNITPDDLQSINIQEYSKQDDVQENTKKEKTAFYQFEPSSVDVKLKDNSVYRLQNIFIFLKSFNIETNNGSTKLFTIFGDTFEKSKGWRDAESKDPNYHKIHPHPASVKKIIFIRVEKEP